MPASKAQQKAVSKYMKENYDVFQIRMKKGKKETIQSHAENQGQSVNAYINAAIDTRMAQESTDGAGVVSLPPDTIKAAQEAAKAAGEAVPQFIDRAVTTQAKRDEAERKLKGGGQGGN